MFHFGENTLPSRNLLRLIRTNHGIDVIVLPFVIKCKKLTWYWNIDGDKEATPNNLALVKELKREATNCHIKMEIIRVLRIRRQAIIDNEEYTTPIWWR